MRSLWERVSTFFKETRQEFRHVNWPTGREALYLTAVVVGLSLAVAAFLGFFDYLFFVAVRDLVR